MRLTQIFKPIKSVSILTVLAVCLAFTNADARKLSGQIVDRSGDIRDVTFNIPFRFLSSTPNFESIQFRIVYFDDAGQRQVLKPDDAREISFTFN